ncbi:hypothetical protein E2562_001066, partial [Oryza meyeriana var. granulata]
MGKRRVRRWCSGKRRGGGEGGGGKRPREGESEEDYCFACKDGGLLRFCDYRFRPRFPFSSPRPAGVGLMVLRSIV